MNWLLLKSDAQIKANVSLLSETILLKYKDTITVVNTDKIMTDEAFASCCGILTKGEHVIICDETFAVAEKDSVLANRQNLLLGILIGRNIPVFSVSPVVTPFVNYQIRVFDTEEQMAAGLNSSYKTLQLQDLRQSAFGELMQMGIPFTPDCFATYVEKDKIDICQKFLDAGMDVNIRESSGTPMLNIAVRSETPEIVEWLLKKGANINAISKDRGYSAVMDAVWKKNVDITKILVARGADLSFVSKEGQSILVLAVGIGDVEVCRILADHGADPDIKDQMGMSAYEYAALFKKDDIVAVLAPHHREREN
ncbi:MAG: ankyrin repeat domain-containing protein [Treponema sp.]|nr:ankyrin repeat domain-containing protein [Treponema sp.]